MPSNIMRSPLFIALLFLLEITAFYAHAQSPGFAALPDGLRINAAPGNASIYVPLYILGSNELDKYVSGFLKEHWTPVREAILQIHNCANCADTMLTSDTISSQFVVPHERYEELLTTLLNKSADRQLQEPPGEGLGDFFKKVQFSVLLKAKFKGTVKDETKKIGCNCDMSIPLPDNLAREFRQDLLNRENWLNTLRVLPIPAWDPQGEGFTLRLMTAVPKIRLEGQLSRTNGSINVASVLESLTSRLRLGGAQLPCLWEKLLDGSFIDRATLREVKSCMPNSLAKDCEAFWSEIWTKALATQLDDDLTSDLRDLLGDASSVKNIPSEMALDALGQFYDRLNSEQKRSFRVLSLFEVDKDGRWRIPGNMNISFIQKLKIVGNKQYEIRFAYRDGPVWDIYTVRVRTQTNQGQLGQP